jgi:hypothetical protein
MILVSCAYQGGPLEFACEMLSHTFPRVRRYTAENLYIRFLENPDLASGTGESQSALELLLNNAWDGDLDAGKAREMAIEVAEKLGVGMAASVSGMGEVR